MPVTVKLLSERKKEYKLAITALSFVALDGMVHPTEYTPTVASTDSHVCVGWKYASILKPKLAVCRAVALKH